MCRLSCPAGSISVPGLSSFSFIHGALVGGAVILLLAADKLTPTQPQQAGDSQVSVSCTHQHMLKVTGGHKGTQNRSCCRRRCTTPTTCFLQPANQRPAAPARLLASCVPHIYPCCMHLFDLPYVSIRLPSHSLSVSHLAACLPVCPSVCPVCSTLPSTLRLRRPSSSCWHHLRSRRSSMTQLYTQHCRR